MVLYDCEEKVRMAADADIRQNETKLAQLDMRAYKIAPDLKEEVRQELLKSAALTTCSELGVGTDGKMDRESIDQNITEAIKSDRGGVRENLLKNFRKEVGAIEKTAEAKNEALRITENWLEKRMSIPKGTKFTNKEALRLALDNAIDFLGIKPLKQSKEQISEILNEVPRDTAQAVAISYEHYEKSQLNNK